MRKLSAAVELPLNTEPVSGAGEPHFDSNFTPAEFERAVAEGKELIYAGECFQIVLSQRFRRKTTANAVSLYRALRATNPSPYMFLLKLGPSPDNGAEQALIGASPEMLVRCRDRELTYRPIAGTRARGANAEQDAHLAKELLADEKERAEHMMLVDLGRNDLGRVSRYGTVKVNKLMTVEKYSHVMHLVTELEAELRPELDRFDALGACFPAGTVTGAPKIRAMQGIAELERGAREAYSGAVLYADYANNLDSCITIRTMELTGDELSVQAGAGIVADSVPATEWEETVNKSRALRRAVALAEAGQNNAERRDNHAARHRQLRFVHLQPGAVPGRARSRARGAPQRSGHRRRDCRRRLSRHRHLARPRRAQGAGVSLAAIRELGGKLPILGVCLGHQAIGEAFGGRIVRAPQPVHGKASRVTHDGRGIFAGVPAEIEVGRYHSLVIEPATCPQVLEVTATTADGIIMGVRHRSLPIEGVQFHPESVLTGSGMQILANFVRLCAAAPVLV